MLASAAIYHHPDAVESAERPLAGRRAAGQSFLAGFARHVQADKLHCVADSRGTIEHFRKLVVSFGWKGPVEGALMHTPRRLAVPGTVMFPGPKLAAYAWIRRRAGQRTFAICGITHTVSTRRIMDGLLAMMSAPIEDWDAIVCTSKAVHDVAKTQIDATEDYLRRRFGARQIARPQLPIIPLGIDTEQFQSNEAERAIYRKKFNLGEDDVAIMAMSRLNFYEKMHTVPLLLAAQRAVMMTGRKITLLLVGWFANKLQEKLHRDAAEAFAPDVSVQFPNGEDRELRYAIWSAADIFALPVDNIQETFGLAPVEAMAAGLPIVCSDWNGFKDTVVHSETGFRIRTLMSPPSSGTDLAYRFEEGIDNYYQYLGSVHQQTVVDVREMAEALAALANDADRRRAMGDAGVKRARQLYDWSVIIPQYQALWGEQTARRRRGFPSIPREEGEPANPAAIDPFTLYRGYPTDCLTVTARVSTDAPFPQSEIEKFIKLTGATDLRRVVASSEDLATLHKAIYENGPIRIDKLVAKSGLKRPLVIAGVLWLAKFDRIQINI